MERIGLNEEQIIINLNKFYPFFFEYLKEEKNQMNDYNFIPNEKGIYMQFDKVYENEDIDDDIREILILLNKKKDFNETLIHKKINLSVIHQKKTLEDIIKIIDSEFEKYYKKLENININHRLHESNNIINDEKSLKLMKEFKLLGKN